MSELIDRQALLDECLNHYEVGNIEQNCTMDWICKTVRNFPAASPWHRVEEELPDEVGSYLVYAPTYIGGSSSAKECKAGVMFARWLKGGHWSIEVGYYKRPGCVTHWMPIEPPKEVQG